MSTARDVMLNAFDEHGLARPDDEGRWRCRCGRGLGVRPPAGWGSTVMRPHVIDSILAALAAAGFVVIDPTDPEVIERACRRLAHQTIAAGYGESWREFSTSVTRVLAALGEPADMPSIAQAMANDPTGEVFE